MTSSLAFALLVPALALGLLVAVAARKAVRDLTELSSARRRRQLACDPAADLAHDVEDALGGTIWTQADLLEVLRSADTDRREQLIAAARSDSVDRTLARACRSRRATVRGRGLLLAAWLRRPGAVAAAVEGLSDPDGDVRLAACAALGAIGTSEAAVALIDALRDDVVPAPRVIERLAAPWATVALVEALGDQDTGRARAGCLRALGLGGDRSVAPVVACWVWSSELEERISATRALGELADPGTAPAVLAALGDDTWEVRAQAAKALGAVRANAAVPALEHALTDHAWWVRANAAHSLAALGEPGLAALRRTAEGGDRYAADRAEEELHLVEAAAAA